METQKLYCAVKVGQAHEEKVAEYLELFKQRGMFQRLECVDPARLHVTTAFLGEVDLAQGSAVLAAARTMAPFDGFLGEGMSFGPRVLILRAYGTGLTGLNRRHAEAFLKVTGKRLEGSNKYVPHLALAKGTGIGSWNDVNAGVEFLVNSPAMPFSVNRVGLYCKGELLEEVELKGGF